MGALADRIAGRKPEPRREPLWRPEPPVPLWVQRAQERRLPAKENLS